MDFLWGLFGQKSSSRFWYCSFTIAENNSRSHTTWQSNAFKGSEWPWLLLQKLIWTEADLEKGTFPEGQHTRRKGKHDHGQGVGVSSRYSCQKARPPRACLRESPGNLMTRLILGGERRWVCSREWLCYKKHFRRKEAGFANSSFP